MKSFRVFVLILLAVLLPIRGAVAAAMLCPGGMEKSSAVMTAGEADHHTHASHDHHGMDSHGATEHHHAQGDAADESSPDGHPGACQFCAGGCCVTPLAFAPPAVQTPLVTCTAVFPAITERVSAHYPDGQDRPPRTI